MLSFLTARFLAYTGGFVALILAGLLAVQTVKLHWANERIGKLEDRVATVEKDRDTWKANFDRSDAATKTCNASIDAAKKEADRRTAESARAASQARAVAESYRKRANAVLSVKAGDDKCLAAERMIAEAVG